MHASWKTISPRITTMIRLDHAHVSALFHRYHAGLPNWRKRALANSVCDALEIHAQLEEEIFYPALREIDDNNPELDKSAPEHDEMRNIIAQLRALSDGSPAYDKAFNQLARTVLHHVADEEAVLLPEAEMRLHAELRQLGAQMTVRRLELLAMRPGEIARHQAAAFPLLSVGLALGAACGVMRLMRRR